jgi:hypothetical protein
MVQTRAYWLRPKRRFQLQWNAAVQSEVESIRSFFRDINGPAGAFLYSPADPIPAPHRSGDPAESTAGSLSLRTYYWVITWVTASGETGPSPEGTFQVSANKLLNITVPKFFYKSITKCRVYVGTSSGSYQLQNEVTTSGGTFIQNSTGLVGGAAPPTSNTAKETVTVHLQDDSFDIQKNTAVSYAINLTFEEIP